MYQFKDHSGREVGLAATHEEPLAEIAARSIFSYRDLPLFVYQIQTKFRDEPRAKSGLIRGREFLMKDLYSFHRDEKDLGRFYDLADQAYRKIFNKAGLDVFVTEASGGSFTSQFTHEYQVLSDAGEDLIIFCIKCRWAQNQEIAAFKKSDACPRCSETLELGKSIEVGNIFKLGTKFSEAFGLTYADENGEKRFVVMGSYGIGPGRMLGTIVEAHNDSRGIIWPESVAPFRVHLIEFLPKGGTVAKTVRNAVEEIYGKLLANGVDVLYDDRVEKTAGEKFADADLIGIPWRVVVSEKTTGKKSLELKARGSEKTELVSMDSVLSAVQNKQGLTRDPAL